MIDHGNAQFVARILKTVRKINSEIIGLRWLHQGTGGEMDEIGLKSNWPAKLARNQDETGETQHGLVNLDYLEMEGLSSEERDQSSIYWRSSAAY
jgi:hypothetical protein